MATILYVDDEPAVGAVIDDTLQRNGHQPIGARDVPEAMQILARGGIDLIISDYRMPGVTGLEFLGLLARDGCDVPVIMVTGYGSIEHAVASIKAGAIDYITKPIRPAQFELAVEQALEFVRLRRENEALRREVMEFRNERKIIGESPSMQRILQTVAMAAPTRAAILLQGESGTGKELFARAIHAQSGREKFPFIQLNCAALPEGLIESALFGHERGAFTGAVKRVEGAFERAHRGTLLLDEVSEMRLDLQAKLLRVLQEQEFERVGGTSPVRVDVRVIATTNRDLAAEAEAGTFRQDLYFRLGVIPILIPPLRERRSDIPLLAHRLAERAAAELGKEIQGIAPEAMDFLVQQDWPGNVRELQHAVERAVIFSTESTIQLHAFDTARYGLTPARGNPQIRTSGEVAAEAVARATLADAETAALPPITKAPVGLSDAAPGQPLVALETLNLADVEATLIARALELSGGHRERAAKMLGMSVRTLRHKLNAPGSLEASADSQEQTSAP